MTRDPYSDPKQWHDLARLVVNERLESATQTLYCEDRDRNLRARYYPLEGLLVLEESADDIMSEWFTVAEYEGPDLPSVVRGDREAFVAALTTYDRAEKTRKRVWPMTVFQDLEQHATLVQCDACGHEEVVAGSIDEWPDCCDAPDRHGPPLVNQNDAKDLVAAPFEERLESMADGPAREAILELYEELFPPFDEREVSDSDE